MKKILLCLAFVASAALLAVAVQGCDNNGTMGNDGGGGTGGGGGGGSGDMAMNNSPDMAFVCVTSPTMDPDFLNSCAPASVQFVDIMPFYPALAPNGTLPSLP